MTKPLSVQVKELQGQMVNLELAQQRLEKFLDEALELIQVQAQLLKELYKKEV